MSLPLLHAGKSAPGLSAALDLRFALDKSLTAYRGPTPSFSRASTGTYFNSSGVLTTAAINAPRFDHTYNGTSWVSRGLLVEEQRTNLALWSEDISNGYWTKTNCSITADAIVSPDGNSNADLAEFLASGTAARVFQTQSFSVTSGTSYTKSFFVKSGTQRWIQIVWSGGAHSARYANFDTLTMTFGTVSANVTTSVANVGNGWYRVSATSAATATALDYFWIYAVDSGTSGWASSSTSGGSVYVFGFQHEVGAFPTSYIPTTTASATRSADVCQITGGDFSGFWNGTEGSFVTEYDRLFTPSSGAHWVWQIDNTTDSERFGLVYEPSAAPVGEQMFVIDGNSVQARVGTGGVVSGTPGKFASCYKVNDFAGTLNGSSVNTDTSGTLPTVTQWKIGYHSTSYLNGHIARLRYFNKRLPNATLQQLSNPDPTLNLQFALNKSLTPVAGPAPSFSRASTGTYFNASGVLTSASINTPRFDHVFSGGQWVSRGLLVEEQRTNSLNYSEDFTNAIYVKNNSTVLSNAGVAPDGTATADLIYPTASSSGVYYNSYSGTSQYSASVFAKAAGKSFFYFYANDGASLGASFNLSNGTVSNVLAGSSATITNVGNGWFRCTITSPSTASYLLWQVAFQDAQGSGTTVTPNGTDGILFWGAQRELGAFPTSYIPTTSASVTRSADVCQITGTNFSGFWNGTEGTVAAEFDFFFSGAGWNPSAWTALTSSTNFLQQYRSGATDLRFFVYPGSVQADFSIGSYANPSKTTVAYKANDFAGSANGAAVATDTLGTVPAVDKLYIMAAETGNIFSGHIAKLIYYPARLTNTKLQQLST